MLTAVGVRRALGGASSGFCSKPCRPVSLSHEHVSSIWNNHLSGRRQWFRKAQKCRGRIVFVFFTEVL